MKNRPVSFPGVNDKSAAAIGSFFAGKLRVDRFASVVGLVGIRTDARRAPLPDISAHVHAPPGGDVARKVPHGGRAGIAVQILRGLQPGGVEIIPPGQDAPIGLPISVVDTLDTVETLQHTKVERHEALLHTPDLKGVKVMVVDDEADAIRLVKRIMEDGGATVTACTSGAECLDCVSKLRPDVVIMDIGMPDMDGYTLIGKLRALSPEQGGRTPVVSLTAFTRSEDRRQAMLAGFDVHVAKPAEPSELVAVVSRLARRI